MSKKISSHTGLPPLIDGSDTSSSDEDEKLKQDSQSKKDPPATDAKASQNLVKESQELAKESQELAKVSHDLVKEKEQINSSKEKCNPNEKGKAETEQKNPPIKDRIDVPASPSKAILADKTFKNNLKKAFSSSAPSQTVTENASKANELVDVSTKAAPSSLSKQQISKSVLDAIKANLQRASKHYLDEAFTMACQRFQDALELLETETHAISCEEWFAVRFCYARACMETGTAVSLDSAQYQLSKLTKLVEQEDVSRYFTPLILYAEALLQKQWHKYKSALEKCSAAKQFLDEVNRFGTTLYYPGLQDVLPISKLPNFTELLESLTTCCKNPPKPNKICTISCECAEPEIYFSHPQFDGYYLLSCSCGCELCFHVSCYQALLRRYDVSKAKDLLGIDCMAENCRGILCSISYFDEKLKLKSEVDFDETNNAKDSEKCDPEATETVSGCADTNYDKSIERVHSSETVESSDTKGTLKSETQSLPETKTSQAELDPNVSEALDLDRKTTVLKREEDTLMKPQKQGKKKKKANKGRTVNPLLCDIQLGTAPRGTGSSTVFAGMEDIDSVTTKTDVNSKSDAGKQAESGGKATGASSMNSGNALDIFRSYIQTTLEDERIRSLLKSSELGKSWNTDIIGHSIIDTMTDQEATVDQITLEKVQIFQNFEDEQRRNDALKKQLNESKSELSTMGERLVKLEKQNAELERINNELLARKCSCSEDVEAAKLRATIAEVSLLTHRRDAERRELTRIRRDVDDIMTYLRNIIKKASETDQPGLQECLSAWQRNAFKLEFDNDLMTETFNNYVTLVESGVSLATLPPIQIPEPPTEPKLPSKPTLESKLVNPPARFLNQIPNEVKAMASSAGVPPPGLSSVLLPATLPGGHPTKPLVLSPTGKNNFRDDTSERSSVSPASTSNLNATPPVLEASSAVAASLYQLADQPSDAKSKMKQLILAVQAKMPGLSNAEVEKGIVKFYGMIKSIKGINKNDLVDGICKAIVETQQQARQASVANVVKPTDLFARGPAATAKPVDLFQRGSVPTVRPVDSFQRGQVPIGRPIDFLPRGSASPRVDPVETEEVCSVCLEPLSFLPVLEMDCGHVGHNSCLRSWLEREKTCPECRALVLPPDEFPRL